MASPDSRRITRTIPASQMVALLLAFLLAATAGGVLAAGFVIPAVAGANLAADSTVEIYDEVPAELEPRPLSQQSRIYAANGRLLATIYNQNRIVKPLDEISEYMQHAVIAIEDERFYEHNGVDPRGITRAAVHNFTNEDSTQGASTLTQQYVKNMLIESALQDGDQFAVIDAHEDSLNRKLREAKMAIAIEKQMSKDEILEGYLNVAQFGSASVYGVEAAARYFFDTTAADLTVVQAATIAGITKAPSNFDPTRNPEEAEKRRNLVLTNMWNQGYISTQERDEAQAIPVEDTLDVQPVENGCQAANHAAFFCDYVMKEILLSPAFGETRAERQTLLYRGGLDIHTTLDWDLQKKANKTIINAVPEDDESNLEASIVSVEPGTGEVKVMAQNVPYTGTDAADDASRDTTVSFNADYVHGASGGFSPGSNFKPVVLAEWLKSGHTLNETVSASERTYVDSSWNAPCASINHAPWTPGNAEGQLSGQISVLKATYLSVNTAYISMGNQLNLCDLRGTAFEMGFRPTSESNADNKGPIRSTTVTEENIDVQPSMLLGSQESSPMNMAAMYATIASGGTYCSPVAITEVTGPNGEEYEVPEADCDKNALPSNVAATMAYAMENVFTRGTAYSLGGLADGRPVAGKTGTSQWSAQTWFSGFVPQMATTVWVGSVENPQEDHTGYIRVNGVGYPILYGSTVAAPTWKEYMDQAVEGMPVKDFGAPDPALIGSAPTTSSSSGGSDSGDDDGSDNGGSDDDDGGNGGGNGNGGGGGNGGGRGGDGDDD